MMNNNYKNDDKISLGNNANNEVKNKKKNNSKKPENVKKKKKLFSRNRIYSLPHEGLFPHISVVTVTTFPSTSLIFSN